MGASRAPRAHLMWAAQRRARRERGADEMNRARIVTMVVMVAAWCGAACEQTAEAQAPVIKKKKHTEVAVTKSVAKSSIYDIKVKTIDGADTTLGAYKGKKLLIVNVASECGYTRQYPGLQALWEREKANGLVVLGFPSNDFGGQEPGSEADIKAFCTGGKYTVDFPMFAKIQVKPGEGQHPLYALLTEATGEQVAWNFNKFLVDSQGNVLRRFDSKVEPESEELAAAIKAAP
jgi:glutathione peroxidase